MIPFSVVIPPEERDPLLQEKLFAEREGILGWMIDGCKAWHSERLGKPDRLHEAVRAYRSEMDVLGAFLEECTVVDVGSEVKASVLYDYYTKWAKRSGEFAMSQTRFGRTMDERGEGSVKRRDGRWHADRRLVEEENCDHVYRGSKE